MKWQKVDDSRVMRGITRTNHKRYLGKRIVQRVHGIREGRRGDEWHMRTVAADFEVGAVGQSWRF